MGILHSLYSLVPALFILAGSAMSSDALAQSYPAKPVRIISPFSPGSSSDIIGRLFAAKLTESWGQAVLVENRAGAGGTIGIAYVAKAAPDGYTFLMGGCPLPRAQACSRISHTIRFEISLR